MMAWSKTSLRRRKAALLEVFQRQKMSVQNEMIVDSVSRIGNMDDLRQRSLRPYVPPS
jgi:hypothetical protein